MDYKELIGQLKYYGTTYAIGDNLGREICGSDKLMLTAADAIKTLLAERDALMKDAARCATCLHVKECYFNELRRADCAQSNRGHWKWRGPQKEGGA